MKPLFLLLLWLTFYGVSRAADWPQWRGPDRSGRVPENSPVPTSISADPKRLWRLEIGGGFSSPVVAGNHLIYLDGQGDKEVAHMVDADSGKEIWHVPYAALFQDEWGPGPRSTPIIDGDRVYVQSCNGEFCCLNLADGKTIWSVNFEKDFGVRFLGNKANEGTASRRGNNGSPVIDGDHVIVPVGATDGATLVCFDKKNGKVLWKTGNDEAAYSSLMVATLAGTKEIVTFDAEALMGVEASSGKILWRVPLVTGAKRHAMTPVIFGDNIAVNSQTIGLVCFKIMKDGEGQHADRAWVIKDLKINLATPVFYDNHLYCAGENKNYVCVDALTGKKCWSQPGFGDKMAVTILLGKNLLVTTDLGDMFFIAADPVKYTELAHTQLTGKTWNHPAYANGKLYMREGLNSGWKLNCFELMPKSAKSF